MKKSSILLTAAVIVGVLALAGIILRLVSGAVAVIGGLFNTILAIIVVLALVLIVAWMLNFARKNR